jgi:hypothetical protein
MLHFKMYFSVETYVYPMTGELLHNYLTQHHYNLIARVKQATWMKRYRFQLVLGRHFHNDPNIRRYVAGAAGSIAMQTLW